MGRIGRRHILNHHAVCLRFRGYCRCCNNRKSADDTKREDAALHDWHLSWPFCMTSSIAPPQAIAGHLRLATDPPPSGFFLRSMQAKLSLWLAKRKRLHIKAPASPGGRGTRLRLQRRPTDKRRAEPQLTQGALAPISIRGSFSALRTTWGDLFQAAASQAPSRISIALMAAGLLSTTRSASS